MMTEQRKEDQRINEIHENVQKIFSTLMGENGICVRVSVSEKAIDSIQNELTEQKETCKTVQKEKVDHRFRLIDVVLAAGLLFIGVLEWLKR